MKPNIEEFRKISYVLWGNITKIAYYFGVDRRIVYRWMRNEEYMEAIEDSRGSFLDECIQMARLVALGVPELDLNGKFVRWKIHPDARMLRYFMSTLGKNEGFGANTKETLNEESFPAARVLTKSEFQDVFGKTPELSETIKKGDE